MATSKPRWNKEATEKLFDLFDTGQADPTNSGSDYLKDLYDSVAYFKFRCPNRYQFNQTYKRKAREYCLEKEKSGARRE